MWCPKKNRGVPENVPENSGAKIMGNFAMFCPADQVTSTVPENENCESIAERPKFVRTRDPETLEECGARK